VVSGRKRGLATVGVSTLASLLQEVRQAQYLETYSSGEWVGCWVWGWGGGYGAVSQQCVYACVLEEGLTAGGYQVQHRYKRCWWRPPWGLS
jgi:hypothetical protein